MSLYAPIIVLLFCFLHTVTSSGASAPVYSVWSNSSSIPCSSGAITVYWSIQGAVSSQTDWLGLFPTSAFSSGQCSLTLGAVCDQYASFRYVPRANAGQPQGSVTLGGFRSSDTYYLAYLSSPANTFLGFASTTITSQASSCTPSPASTSFSVSVSPCVSPSVPLGVSSLTSSSTYIYVSWSSTLLPSSSTQMSATTLTNTLLTTPATATMTANAFSTNDDNDFVVVASTTLPCLTQTTVTIGSSFPCSDYSVMPWTYISLDYALAASDIAWSEGNIFFGTQKILAQSSTSSPRFPTPLPGSFVAFYLLRGSIVAGISSPFTINSAACPSPSGTYTISVSFSSSSPSSPILTWSVSGGASVANGIDYVALYSMANCPTMSGQTLVCSGLTVSYDFVYTFLSPSIPFPSLDAGTYYATYVYGATGVVMSYQLFTTPSSSTSAPTTAAPSSPSSAAPTSPTISVSPTATASTPAPTTPTPTPTTPTPTPTPTSPSTTLSPTTTTSMPATVVSSTTTGAPTSTATPTTMTTTTVTPSTSMVATTSITTTTTSTPTTTMTPATTTASITATTPAAATTTTSASTSASTSSSTTAAATTAASTTPTTTTTTSASTTAFVAPPNSLQVLFTPGNFNSVTVNSHHHDHHHRSLATSYTPGTSAYNTQLMKGLCQELNISSTYCSSRIYISSSSAGAPVQAVLMPYVGNDVAAGPSSPYDLLTQIERLSASAFFDPSTANIQVYCQSTKTYVSATTYTNAAMFQAACVNVLTTPLPTVAPAGSDSLSTSTIASAVVGAVLTGIIGLAFWKWRIEKEASLERARFPLANSVLKCLSLRGLSNFSGGSGLAFQKMMSTLEDELYAQKILQSPTGRDGARIPLLPEEYNLFVKETLGPAIRSVGVLRPYSCFCVCCFGYTLDLASFREHTSAIVKACVKFEGSLSQKFSRRYLPSISADHDERGALDRDHDQNNPLSSMKLKPTLTLTSSARTIYEGEGQTQEQGQTEGSNREVHADAHVAVTLELSPMSTE